MLQELDRLSEGTEFVVGHNVTAHDLRELGRHDPELQLLRLAPVDTLILSPIAFPQRPYHHLVKPYKTPALARLQANDPLLDARTAAVLLDDICAAFTEKHESAPVHIEAWHWLLTRTPAPQGYDTLFRHIRGAATPSDKSARRAIVATLEGRGCPQEAERIAAAATNVPLPTAWLITWTSVAETGSIIPPYIWHRAPQVRDMVRALRMRPCDDESCAWCSERHDAEKELKRWLGFDAFRPDPVTSEGRPAQREIVVKHLQEVPVLAVMPTGAGKSLCYQLPALTRHAGCAELDRGDLAAGGTHERPGRKHAGKGGRLRRDHQRDADAARTGKRAHTGGIGRSRHRAARAGVAAQPPYPKGARATGDRRMGAG